MKKKKYLPLYYEWMKNQRLPHYGLCWCFGSFVENDVWKARYGYDDFELFIPTEYTEDYWADDGSSDTCGGAMRYFNPLRQNIVLFLAAMNREL